jgi:hypothetical protein
MRAHGRLQALDVVEMAAAKGRPRGWPARQRQQMLDAARA